ncbi:MAG: Gldg family protein [Alphaproteobacteria bacterium]|nr:Gldg family protein [Alphaproteobacteria bacterium]
MDKIKSIIKYELVRYFMSPLAYVYLISFLLLSGSCAIYFGHFFMDGKANLWGLFDYQPWIYLLFIPGIAMRSWSEEFRSKSIVQTLTLPVKLSDIVWGKFFASWIFAIGAIMLTFPFWITVNLLGNPDNTVILIGYLGCFILSGAMLAISQTMSAVSKNSVIALVLAVFVNLLFFWSSFEYVLFWARELFSDTIVDTIISFSFWIRFFSLSRGLVEFRDLIFFASLIVFFNVLTFFIIGLKTKGNSSIVSSLEPKHSIIYILLLLIGFFSINIVANNVFRQISYDFTEEKYLSLTRNTKDVLKKLKRPVVAKLYYSPILEKRNPNIRQIFDQVKLMLKQYKSYSRGKFDYRIYNPKFLDKNEDRALADGLQPIPLIDIGQNALFGITFSDSLVNKSVIPFFSLERLSFLEQDLTTSIYKLHHNKKTLGLLSSLPIAGDIRLENVSMKRWEIFNQIKELYNVKVIEKEEDLDENFDVFMIVHPLLLTENVIEKIKKQKKVLLLLDVVDDASLLYSPLGGSFVSSDLGSLADYWGISFYDKGVAADFDNSIMVDDTTNYGKDPSFTQDLLQFKTKEKDFNPNHRITYKLNEILFSSASMVYVKDEAKVSYFPLIKTSKNSAMVHANVVKNKVSPKELLKNFAPDNSPIILAAEFLSNDPSKPFNVIAVGDTDFIYDAFWTRESKFLDKSFHIPLFDNANFILNSLDYLTENDDLISLRGKTIKKRPLDVVDNMRRVNVYKYKLKENDIFNAIEGAKYSLKEVIAKKTFEKRESFSADELAVIGNIRKEINSLRHQLSTLKINANMDIEKLEIKVKFFNIYFIALLILVIVLIVGLRRKVFSANNWKEFLYWNKAISKLSFIVCGVLSLAILSVYLDNRNVISQYEGKYVFEKLNDKLNSIKKITLKNAGNELVFEFNKGKWELKDSKLPVYQERIRSFLVSLCNMVYYEKKSDKVEDIKYFGFSDLKDENSPTIEVELLDDKGLVVSEFDIGWYDLDLGRGSKASYIKFKNQFQVWKVEADFYDLSLDKKNWTYSSLWNLRFGRFIEYNDINDDKKVMNIVKNMLNIYAKDIHNDVLDVSQIGKIRIKSENDNYFDVVFYEKDNRYFVKYDFIAKPKGKHLKIFAESIDGKYIEILKQDWELLKDDTTRDEQQT